LAECLIEDDRHGVGEVEAAHARLENRNAISGVTPGGEEIRAKSFGLAAEDEEITTTILCFDVVFVAMSRKILEVCRVVRSMESIEVLPIGIGAQINEWPIIESGALEIAIGQ